jgi:hypothetical protein
LILRTDPRPVSVIHHGRGRSQHHDVGVILFAPAIVSLDVDVLDADATDHRSHQTSERCNAFVTGS